MSVLQTLAALDGRSGEALALSSEVYPPDVLRQAAARLDVRCAIRDEGQKLFLQVEPVDRLDELLNEALIAALAGGS